MDKKNNTGLDNSGYRNSGDYNSGYRNSGDYNSGDYNSGDYNSGCRNSGYRNSGNYNSGDYNSGWFNTNEPKMRFFNKDSDITYSEFSKNLIVYPDLHTCHWVDYKDLPKDEQNTDTKNMDGKLVTMDYKEAWKEYWGRARESDKNFFKTLPNFSEEIFFAITGIKVNEEIQEVTMEQVCAKFGKNVKIKKVGTN